MPIGSEPTPNKNMRKLENSYNNLKNTLSTLRKIRESRPSDELNSLIEEIESHLKDIEDTFDFNPDIDEESADAAVEVADEYINDAKRFRKK